MKILGLDILTLREYYVKEVRVHLELAAHVWHSGLTRKLSADLERVQRVAVTIMLGNVPYLEGCTTLGLDLLSDRRLELCRRFAAKTASSKSRHSDLFEIITGQNNTRSKNGRYWEHKCKKRAGNIA